MKQGKIFKKALSMLMALTMLFGVMTAVTVSAAAEEWEVVKTIDFDGYEIKTGFESHADIYTHCTADIVVNADDSSDRELLVYGLNSAGTQHRFNIKGLPFEQGKTYKMTFNAKANIPTGVAVNLNTFTTGVTYKSAKALSSDWKEFEIEYTHSGADTTDGVIVLCTNALVAPNVNQTWIDDIVVSKKIIKPEVTVNVGKGGTVTYGEESVTGRQKYAVENGADVTLTVTPESGKYATVKVDGAVVTPDANNQITLEDVSADSTVDVLFTENGWEKVVYIDFDGFGSISDLPQATSSGNRTTVAVTDSDTNSTVSQTTFAGTPARVFNSPSVNWESGATYRLSYDVKASRDGIKLAPGITIAGYSDGNKTAAFNANGTANPTLTTSWQSVEQQANILEFTNGLSSFSNQAYVNATGAQSGDIIYFDNFTIEKKIPVTNVDVTVNIVGNGGTVTYGETPVANGDEISVAKGSNLTLTVTPENNYSAAVTKDGQELPISEGTVSFVVDADSVVTVTFTEKTPVPAGIVKDVTYEQFTLIEGVPTIYVYSQLNNFTTGEDNLNYGIKLWKQDASDNKLTLNAYDAATKQPAFAQANKAFAIRIYGKAITADQVYKIQPFVGVTEGEVLSVEIEE